ncbi:related to NAB2-nuclear polyadenylated RNA-binding protein required for nuclear mRNA export [Sporisorium scitamineum]|uniref:Related to NAB2-nuclear polyadenylated RNA-binding protein required for nuclear mRNA export n=1 Tax=Sporisorium scitamineum TaxID=49012 RepID=A0A0F7S3K0_9BASI|nr:hypothetical protein [Sporisorium scitamineum]CDU22350.1 related to NAB2-nuclear polyadenylated RNA-binding protein required for nuclear mRNA export [Sporisorium scitamineum]
MSSFRNIDVKAPHIQQLQYQIQLELANRDYSSPDDPVMAEYIVVMLANQKTPDQITSEMNDLIGSDYDAAFTDWIWRATQECLDTHAASTSVQTGSSADAPTSTSIPATVNAGTSSSLPARTRNYRQRRSRSPQASGAASRARDQRRSRSPTARRANDHRRSRSRSPSSRTSTFNQPGHRQRDYSSNEAWRKSISLLRDDEPPFDGEAFWRSKAEERRRNPPPPAINREINRLGGPSETRLSNAAYGQAVRNGNGHSGRELFPKAEHNDEPLPSYQESAGLSIFGRAGVPDPRAAAFVPSSAALHTAEVVDTSSAPVSAADPAVPAQSTSIFARIDPMLPNNQPLTAAGSEATLPSTVHSSDFPTQPTETSICRWNVGCTNPMCPYSHASPANASPNGDPNALVLSQQNCRYGARCINKDCTRSHVSPAVAKIQARAAAPVSFNPTTASTAPVAAAAATAPTLSMDAALPSQFSSKPCRFGAACTRLDCCFSHPPTRNGASTNSVTMGRMCRFGLGCTRSDCYFAHPPGQRASGVGGGTSNRLQVFAQSNGGEEMEVIIPGAQQQQQQQRGEGERSGSETVRSEASVNSAAEPVRLSA